ncbi:LTA synthase family protein, partial [Desulfovibrio sp. OttesenSCG-928-A18]|nr:LTA synthase family protein [Desulfovibrio sp. OttesenSCG-928-A18]
MTIRRSSPALPPLTLYLLLLGYIWLLLALARFAFALWIQASLDEASAWDIIKGLYLGLRFDGRLAALLSLPAGLALCFAPLARGLAARKRRLGPLFFLIFFCLWALYALDVGFYDYLGVRLNSVIFELLEDVGVNLTMVWESYPIIRISLAVVSAAILSAMGASALIALPLRRHKSRKGALLCFLAGLLVFSWACWGQISSNLFPLRWSNAYFSPDQGVTALALNPVQNLFDTYRASRGRSFDPELTRAAYPLMLSYLGIDNPDPDSLNYDRAHKGAGQPAGSRAPNVIIIIAESLSHHKSSFAPGKDDPSPAIKALAADSLYFPHFFANARTTARAIFTTMTGIPDVTASSTGSRSQYVIDQRIIADQFAGYDKFYMIGGNTSWANIRGILGNNIEGLHILEEGFWKAPNVDVWGVSDRDLLMKAHAFFKSRTDKPFLAVIQLASFHKPFTVPKTPGFEKRRLSEDTQYNYGFVSEDEYNSMRYMDFALGEFFRLARESEYYSNTIFVLFGDHGINELGENMHDTYTAANLGPWHVPLIIHAPGRLAPGVNTHPASQIDVFPTVAGLAGLSYVNHTLGRNLLDPRFDRSRAAFISGKPGTAIRLVQDGWCYVDNRAGSLSLYNLREQQARDRKDEEPERFEAMRALAEAFEN